MSHTQDEYYDDDENPGKDYDHEYYDAPFDDDPPDDERV